MRLMCQTVESRDCLKCDVVTGRNVHVLHVGTCPRAQLRNLIQTACKMPDCTRKATAYAHNVVDFQVMYCIGSGTCV